MGTALPDSVSRLLWDVRKETVDPKRHGKFLIRRVLDFGDVAAVNWLRRTFSEEAIRQVVTEGRGLSHKTLAFWRHYLGIGA